ncbi:hypothetical protein PG985_011512 [Apiospora marii]|uniref:Uncharacterized protein n=1 Tax=Apiospora marii TaxID=335849 RepID=A0ABR1R0W1_9PEZI
MCYHPEVSWGCGCRETANSNLERCGGAIAYGIDCIGTMPAPAHRTLHITIPCLDCRNNKQEKGQASLLSVRGASRKSTGMLKRVTACF